VPCGDARRGPEPLLDQVSFIFFLPFSVSNNGTLIYLLMKETGTRQSPKY